MDDIEAPAIVTGFSFQSFIHYGYRKFAWAYALRTPIVCEPLILCLNFDCVSCFVITVPNATDICSSWFNFNPQYGI